MKKKMLALLLAAAMVMGLAAPAMAAEDTDSQDGVVVFYTNDVHTYIDNSYTVDEESGQEAPALRYSTVAALKASVPGWWTRATTSRAPPTAPWTRAPPSSS